MPESEKPVFYIQEELLTLESAAELLKVSVNTVERELREGRLKGFKRLKKWYLFKSDVFAYVREGVSGKEKE
ncbi:MAG: helix-turn-helix domain-containing protein [Saprospiraceae bacterium]